MRLATILSTIFLLLSDNSLVFGQISKHDEISYKDQLFQLSLNYYKGGVKISNKDLIFILEDVPETEIHLRKAKNSKAVRGICFLGMGIGAAVIVGSNTFNGTLTGVAIIGGGLFLGGLSHAGYLSEMKEAIKIYNGELQKQSYIEVFLNGIVYRF